MVTYKELNINALLYIDWKNTCHYNGPVDISESNNDRLVIKGHFLNIHGSRVAAEQEASRGQ